MDIDILENFCILHINIHIFAFYISYFYFRRNNVIFHMFSSNHQMLYLLSIFALVLFMLINITLPFLVFIIFIYFPLYSRTKTTKH